MNTKIFFFILMLSASSVFFSCSSSSDEVEYIEVTDLDFEEGTYRPTPLNLDNIPPFSWMGMPDSVKKETTFRIRFNEDAIRSNSNAKIRFVDSNGNPVDGITIDGSNSNYFDAIAKNEAQEINVSYIVNPAVGDSLLSGMIVVAGADLDQVNEISLNSNTLPVATWQLNHRVGINWLRWGVLIALILLMCYVIFILCCLLYGAGLAIAESLQFWSFPTLSLPSFNLWKKKKSRKKQLKNKKKKRKKEVEKLLKLEAKLYEQRQIYQKYDVLEEMRLVLDKIYKKDNNTYCDAKDALKNNTWDALEEAWELWNPTPSEDVVWKGRKKQKCVLKKTHTLYEECKKLGMTKCKYDEHGSPDFGNATISGSVVNISDLYEKYSPENLKKRGGSSSSFQDMAQERIAKKLAPQIKKWAKQNKCAPDYWAWRNAHNLVPHEDTNCQTIRLVYKPIHTAFKHRGGIANVNNIKRHFP